MEEPTVASRQGQEAREPKPNPSNQEGAEPIAATANVSDKKRKPDNGGFHNSEYVKVRAIVKELRPFFMEVLHTPDFRESKAAYEIKKSCAGNKHNQGCLCHAFDLVVNN